MKKILLTMAALSLATFGFSQDFGFGDDFGGGTDDFGGAGGFEESSSAPSVSISGEVGASARAWGGSKNDDGEFDTRHYGSAYDLSKSGVEKSAYGNLEFNYSGDFTDMNLKLKFNPGTIKDNPEDIVDEAAISGSFKEGRFQVKAGKLKEVWGKGDKVHVLDNFNANDYTDFIFPDYIDRRIGEVMFKTTANISWDYNIKLEGIYAPMMTADRFASSGPLVPYAQQKLTTNVENLLKAQGSALATKSVDFDNKTVDGDSLIGAIMELSNFSKDPTGNLLEDDIKTIKYGQAGARLTGSVAGIDWGASYYYGHYKQPSAKLEGLISLNYYKTAAPKYADGAKAAEAKAKEYKALAETAAAAATQYASAGDTATAATYAAKAKAAGDAATQYAAAATEAGNTAIAMQAAAVSMLNKKPKELISLNYDQVQTFGLEAAFVLWKLNTRWEGAYNLTEDVAGDNPWIKNNSVSWVAGFDIDIPLHNLNLNVQETGSYILNNNKINDMERGLTIGGKTVSWTTLGNNYDVDYNSDGKYTRNKLIVLLSDKWLNEKLTTEIQGIYGFECKEYMVAPKVEYNISEGLTFGIRGIYLYSDNENGEFYNFTQNTKNHDKAFLELTAKYQF